MTKKVFDNSVEAKVDEKTNAELPAVKQMVRWLAGATDDEGHDAVGYVDSELSEWIKKGYHLFAAHYVGSDQTAIGVLYVLVRDA